MKKIRAAKSRSSKRGRSLFSKLSIQSTAETDDSYSDPSICKHDAVKEPIKIKKQLKKYIRNDDITNLIHLLKTAPIELRDLDPTGSLLNCAIIAHNLEVIDVLLENGAPVVCGSESGCSVMHEVVKSGYIDIVQLLLSHGTDVDQKSLYEHKTPLHTAVQQNNLHIIQLLLKYGADHNKTDIYGRTALHIAAGLNLDDMAQLLLHHGSSVDAIDHVTWTPLHHCAMNNNTRVGVVLIKNKCNITAQTRYGKTALHLACQRGHLGMVEMLLGYDCPTNTKDNSGKLAYEYTNNVLIASLVKNAGKTNDITLDNIKHIDMRVRSKSLIDLLEPEFLKTDYYESESVRPRSLSDGEVAHNRVSKRLRASFKKFIKRRKQSTVKSVKRKEGNTSHVRVLSPIKQSPEVQERTASPLGYQERCIDGFEVEEFISDRSKKNATLKRRLSDDVFEGKPIKRQGISYMFENGPIREKDISNRLSKISKGSYEDESSILKKFNFEKREIEPFIPYNSDSPFQLSKYKSKDDQSKGSYTDLQDEDLNIVTNSTLISQCITNITDTCITSIQEVSKSLDDIQSTDDSDLRFYKVAELKTYLNQWALKTDDFRNNSIHV